MQPASWNGIRGFSGSEQRLRQNRVGPEVLSRVQTKGECWISDVKLRTEQIGALPNVMVQSVECLVARDKLLILAGQS